MPEVDVAKRNRWFGRRLPAALLIAALTSATTAAGTDARAATDPPPAASDAGLGLALWRALDWFNGTWRGTEDGEVGEGPGARCGADLFGGRFRFSWSHIEIQPRSGGAAARFDRWQIISRNPDSGRIELARYASTGYRSLFELDQSASRSDRFVFEARDPGAAGSGRHGRLTLRIRRGNRFEEQLELGDADGPLHRVSLQRWHRVDDAADDCLGRAPSLPGVFAPAN